ncbi:colicin D domain-containing protein [Paenibacillus chitinolyticus]|uniref:colicin D domain-containing protein n=1 Tax=Paenibacillus chitinolyticus TaxID=79263 RepID=UPI0035D7F4FA
MDNPLSLNLYTYVMNNPLTHVDPSGHAQMSAGAGGDKGWNPKITANWTINEAKQKWFEAYSSGGDYKKWSSYADNLRNQMRKSGIAESDIMQSTDDVIPKPIVDMIARNETVKWIDSDIFGIKLYTDAAELLIPDPYSMQIGSLRGSQITFPQGKLQHEFKHSGDFGITGTWNKANGKAYENAIRQHIDDSDILWRTTFRKGDAYLYYNSNTGVGSYIDLNGGYMGGWKLNSTQVNYHTRNGVRIY